MYRKIKEAEYFIIAFQINLQMGYGSRVFFALFFFVNLLYV